MGYIFCRKKNKYSSLGEKITAHMLFLKWMHRVDNCIRGINASNKALFALDASMRHILLRHGRIQNIMHFLVREKPQSHYKFKRQKHAVQTAVCTAVQIAKRTFQPVPSVNLKSHTIRAKRHGNAVKAPSCRVFINTRALLPTDNKHSCRSRQKPHIGNAFCRLRRTAFYLTDELFDLIKFIWFQVHES